MPAQNGVFSELKLSEQLNENLTDVKNRLDDLRCTQEETMADCHSLQTLNKKLTIENEKLKKQLFKAKSQFNLSWFFQLKQEYSTLQITSQKESLEQLTMLSDKRRSEFAELLSKTQSKLDQEELKNMTLNANMSYERMHHEVVMEHLQNLEKNIKDVNNVRKVEDNMNYHITKHKIHIASLIEQIEDVKK